MKLKVWAQKQGIAYLTAYRWFRAGKIPNAVQFPSGTIIVQDPPQPITNDDSSAYVYCRVSNHSRKEELNYQVDRCVQFCNSRGLTVKKVYKEIASGMNDSRKQLLDLLNQNPSIIVVENKDRLTRFGFKYLELLLSKLNCKILVMNVEDNDEHDLMKDMISIVTSFCCRLYGPLSTKEKVDKIKQILNDEEKAEN